MHQREKKKDDKYVNELRLGSTTPAVVPLVQEHQADGATRENCLNLLVKNSSDEEGSANSLSFGETFPYNRSAMQM